LPTLSSASGKEGCLFFSYPLSAKGEERVVERSKDRVSNRRYAKLQRKDSHHFKKNNLALIL
jgi:hypothetical protein